MLNKVQTQASLTYGVRSQDGCHLCCYHGGEDSRDRKEAQGSFWDASYGPFLNLGFGYTGVLTIKL